MLVTSPCASGWCPGSAPSGVPDPSSNPDPSGLINGVVPQLKDALFGSLGAAMLLMIGILALLKGMTLFLGMIKRRREPEQLTLF